MPDPIRILPPTRPRLTEAELVQMLLPYKIDMTTYPLLVVGLRGYYAKSMGATPDNERGIYDDAIFLYAAKRETFPGVFKAFNGNTDPASVKAGVGFGDGKGMAQLKPGIWYSYRFDMHNSKVRPHPAICQRAAPVSVIRDGNPPYPDSGMFGINIHCGGNYKTSSEGCQTLPPSQWDEFIATAQGAGRELFGPQWKSRVVAYVLAENW